MAAALLAVFPACTSDGPEGGVGTSVSAGDGAARITAGDQSTTGERLVVGEVRIGSPGGFVVAYADGGGAPGIPLGQSDLVDGSMADVSIALDEPLSEPGIVHFIVHNDTVADGEFDIESDLPAEVGGSVVVASVAIEIEE